MDYLTYMNKIGLGEVVILLWGKAYEPKNGSVASVNEVYNF